MLKQTVPEVSLNLRINVEEHSMSEVCVAEEPSERAVLWMRTRRTDAVGSGLGSSEPAVSHARVASVFK
jgi:hypothetical protein